MPRKATVLAPTGGPVIEIGPTTTRVLAADEDTDGRCSVYEVTVPRRFPGPPAHVHTDRAHAFYVLDGTVQLTFDFGKGTLDGNMTLALDDYGGGKTQLGTYSFTNTVFSAGSTVYSGKFDTSVAGQNYFLGQFTGPNAEETIGAWALPFIFDNADHQAFGAWLAKQP